MVRTEEEEKRRWRSVGGCRGRFGLKSNYDRFSGFDFFFFLFSVVLFGFGFGSFVVLLSPEYSDLLPLPFQ